MTNFRNDLLTRIIHIYGFENPITISFADMCEKYPNNLVSDEMLERLVEMHETHSQIEDEDED